MYYIYVLMCGDGNLYVGYTSDLRRRMSEHSLGKSYSTRLRRPLRLAYYEAYTSRSDASHRERMLKLHKKAFVMLKKRISRSLLDE